MAEQEQQHTITPKRTRTQRHMFEIKNEIKPITTDSLFQLLTHLFIFIEDL